MDAWEKDKNREAFLRSWEACCQHLGPVLEPAFRGDEPARRTLLAALNCIHRRQLSEGIALLHKIRECCRCDEDLAAWSYFVGFCLELAGEKEHMMHCYRASADCGNRYPRLYLKMAGVAHADADFDGARKDYERAIALLCAMPEARRDAEGLASAYANLAACQTMMHHYREAEESWQKSRALLRTPGSAAVGAILHAALGKGQAVEELLRELDGQAPEQAAGTRALTDRILDGSHPHFHPVPPEPALLQGFWQWFSERESVLQHQEAESAAREIGEKLKAAFPFLEREPQLQLQRSGGKTRLILKDSYAVALQYGYARLLLARPQSLGRDWDFILERA